MSTHSMNLTARNPEDLLAMVPVVLGFVPHDSMVMLTFGADRPFHARVDLPDDPDDPDQVAGLVGALLDPARHHGVRRVVLVAYAADPGLAETLTGALRRALVRVGIEVLGRIGADGHRWWALPRDHPHDKGRPYDVSSHPFAAEAVLHGLVTLGSRGELAATLDPDPVAVAEVWAAVGGGDPPPQAQCVAEAAWAEALVRTCTATGSRPEAGRLARLVVGLRDLGVRDAAWLTMTRADATAHVEFWRDVVRRTPPELVAAPAAVLGFAAWLSGQGALAWCAVDRSREADPDYGLAGVLAEALTSAVPPSTWDTMADTGPGRPA